MKGDAFPENAQARSILCEYGINPYTDCANLVIAQNHCHSRAYAQRTLRLLQEVKNTGGTVQDIEDALARAADLFSKCDFETEVQKNSPAQVVDPATDV